VRLVLVLLLALAACAAPSAAGPPSTGGSSGSAVGQPDDDLLVELDRGDGSAVQRWTLTCREIATGDHPAVQAACDHLRQLDDPFAPVPADAVCTEQYGGPQTARVTGRWRGVPVDLGLSRVDGCRIAQWDSLGPLLPGPVGVLEPPVC
jgi:hypothetical protein